MSENEDVDRPPRHLWRTDDEEEGEDPLITLGHMVKLASIGIWRKVRKSRPDMQERSNSDSMLEVGKPVTYADDEDANMLLVDVPGEDTSDNGPPLPETETTSKTADDETVVVQTQVVSAAPVPTNET